ncbi:triphosphoribosyl-dephospho-CoA synthase [Carboxylicivirga sp. RSCT41]|uniref:triphosphoribosyl-dephospho-CoA synthase n=1 Tax=Carboxylicivirga agarovorans TaxID=3417570 RepID=UPI003D35399F
MEVPLETEVFGRLLEAREKRQDEKLKMVRSGYHLVSLQLNIPGLPKSNAALLSFIHKVDREFSFYLQSQNPNFKWQDKQTIHDVSGDAIIYLFKHEQVDPFELKQITEAFEESFELGRVTDLDVMTSDGKPVSSGKAKQCFICKESAENCRKLKRHSIEEVRQAMLDAIDLYLLKQRNNELLNKLASFATKGLLQEVVLTPKPGLVCRNSAGSHGDMDFISFINSVSALSPYFIELNKYALSFEGADVSKALPYIRVTGLRMEEAMYQATGGVNTHKGAVFLLSISCFAVIRVVKKIGYLKLNSFSSVIQQLTRGMVQNELCSVKNDAELTHGQQCFKKYGLQAAGARGEAEQGLPTVLHHAMPFLLERLKKTYALHNDAELNELLVPVLLKIMTVNNDTNILYRHNKKVLETVKRKAHEALLAWDCGNRQLYEEFVAWCNTNRISPGGSADLLALTITLHHCKTEFAKK